MLSLFRKIWGIYRPLHTSIIVIFLFVALNIGLDLLWPYIYGKTIDTVIAEAGFSAVVNLLTLALGLMVVQNLAAFIQARIELGNFDYESPALAQRLTLKKLLSLSIGQHRNEHSGLTQSVVSDGQGAVRELMEMSLYSYFPFLIRIPFALIALFLLTWKLGVIVLTGLILHMLVSHWTNRKFIPLVREERDMSQDLGKKRSEILRNAPLIITSAAEKYAESYIDEETRKKDEFAKGFWRKYMYSSYVARPIIIDLTLISVLGSAAYFVGNGTLGAGQILTATMWTNNVLFNLGFLSRMQRQLMFAGERAKKYFSILDLSTDVLPPSDPVRAETISGEITFEDVSFVYPKKRIIEDDKKPKSPAPDKAPSEAIRNVSVSIRSGEHVAFVGPSGAGKSTMILLLLRGSDPQAGRITIDGSDLRNIDPEFYRRHVGVVEQHIVLFDDTIRRNISLGLPEGRLLTDEEMDRLAAISRIDEFKDKLVDGWDTVIGENGIKLSGGQRQRVGIARALAKNPSILILDEATSSLDTKNEALIKDALHAAAAGRTTITVAHRLSTIKDADRIYVFDKGTIVGEGKHEDLMKTCPTYSDLISHQTVLL